MQKKKQLENMEEKNQKVRKNKAYTAASVNVLLRDENACANAETDDLKWDRFVASETNKAGERIARTVEDLKTRGIVDGNGNLLRHQ